MLSSTAIAVFSRNTEYFSVISTARVLQIIVRLGTSLTRVSHSYGVLCRCDLFNGVFSNRENHPTRQAMKEPITCNRLHLVSFVGTKGQRGFQCLIQAQHTKWLDCFLVSLFSTPFTFYHGARCYLTHRKTNNNIVSSVFHFFSLFLSCFAYLKAHNESFSSADMQHKCMCPCECKLNPFIIIATPFAFPFAKVPSHCRGTSSLRLKGRALTKLLIHRHTHMPHI